jgi:hypothetical protein
MCSYDSCSQSGESAGGVVPKERADARRSKPCKSRREHYKKIVETTQREIESDPANFDIEQAMHSMPTYIASDERLRKKFVQRLQSFQLSAQNKSGEQIPAIANKPSSRMSL